MVRRASKVDANQAGMVQTWRQCGLHVTLLHRVGGGVPDTLVTGYNRRLDMVCALLVEIKTKRGTLTPDEKRFFDEYPEDGPLMVARTADEVLDWFGLKG